MQICIVCPFLSIYGPFLLLEYIYIYCPALSTPFRWTIILSLIKRVLLEHRDAARGVLMRDMGERETSSSRSCQQKYRHLSVVYCVCIYECVCVCVLVRQSDKREKGLTASLRNGRGGHLVNRWSICVRWRCATVSLHTLIFRWSSLG